MSSTIAPPRPGGVRTVLSSEQRIWLVRVLLVYLGSRLVSTAWYLVAAALAAQGSVGGERPDVLRLLVAWDADGYQKILTEGYPAVLPQDADGNVLPSVWAFMPLYPAVIRVIALNNAAAFPAVAVGVATAFGAAASLALFALVRRHAGERSALVAVALFVLGPAAAVLQAGYAESMALFLLFLLLALVDRQRYWAALAVAVPLALTRPGMQAVAMVVFLHLVLRVVRPVRTGRFRFRVERVAEPFPARQRVSAGTLLVGTALLGFAWLVIAAVVTGRPDAYLATETSWRRQLVGIADLHVFHSWPFAAQQLLGRWPGRLAVLALLVVIAALVLSPQAKPLGPLVRLWFVSWWCYLLAVFYPQSSTVRLLLPVAPIGGVLGQLRAVPLAAVLIVCVALQGALVLAQYALPIAAYSPP